MVLRKSGRVGRRRSLEKDISFAGILFCVVGHPSATAAAAARRPAPRRPAARRPTPCRPTPRRPTPRPPRTEVLGYY